MVILFGILAFGATFLGGLFALRYKDKLHLILGFSAGAIIAVAFFDLLPEALTLSGSMERAMVLIATGFFLFMVLDRSLFFHGHHTEEEAHEAQGTLKAGSLSVHSFLDGLAIGLAFQVSTAVGIIVTVAVLVHDFSDGINTVNMVLKHGGSAARARKWLFVDALAPMVGVIATLFFSVPETVLGGILAVFAGFFLYIGASDLLPESHHAHPTVWTTVATLVGATILYGAIKLAGI